MSRPGLTHQVTVCLSRLEAFGTSRHAALRDGTAANKIFSFSTRREYQRCNVRFVQWCKEQHHIRWLKDITPAMATDYIATLRREGRSPSYIGKMVAAIRKLDVGLRAWGWRDKTAPPLLGAEERGRHSNAKPTPYTAEEADTLIAALARRDLQYGQLAQLQRATGLRVEEAVHLQARCIEPDGSKIILTGPGIHTKGGKEREIPVMPQHQALLRKLREQGESHIDGHIFVHRQTLGRAYGREVSALCRKLGITSGSGSHSFRKTWSGEYYAFLRGQGLSSQEARKRVTMALGHNRLNVLRHYLPVATRSLEYPGA